MNPTNLKACRLLLAIGAIYLPGKTMAATMATYYVSPAGSDANPGTLAAPFQTISKARDVVRTVNGTMTGDIVVTLRGGTYALTSPLAFGTADGGKNGYYVRYVAYTGETSDRRRSHHGLDRLRRDQ
jgi:hypothetical protein